MLIATDPVKTEFSTDMDTKQLTGRLENVGNDAFSTIRSMPTTCILPIIIIEVRLTVFQTS